jgi:hypothetical protein
MPDIGFAGNWDDLLLAAAAVSGAAALLWRNVIRPIGELVRSLARMNETLTDIAHEFQPNEGTSLKDRIERIDQTVEAHRARHDELDARLDALEQERMITGRRRPPDKEQP